MENDNSHGYCFMNKELEERLNNASSSVKKTMFSILKKNLIESSRKCREERLKELMKDGKPNPFGSAPV